MQQMDLISLFENSYTEIGIWKLNDNMLCFTKDENTTKTAEEYVYSQEGSRLSITYTEMNDSGEPVTNVVSFERLTPQQSYDKKSHPDGWLL